MSDDAALDEFMKRKVTILSDYRPCEGVIWRERFGEDVLAAIDKRRDELKEKVPFCLRSSV